MKKKKKEEEETVEDYDQRNLEIVKAVAQARLSYSATRSSLTNEFDAHQLKFNSRPSRFKLQSQIETAKQTTSDCHTSWDFGQSLWDSYEIVNVSRKLEAGLLMDYRLDEPKQIPVKKKESKNSLRNLLNLKSSRRFNETSIPRNSNN